MRSKFDMVSAVIVGIVKDSRQARQEMLSGGAGLPQ
jgi:hypothetical protein